MSADLTAIARLAERNPRRWGPALESHLAQQAAKGLTPTLRAVGLGRNVTGRTLDRWSYVTTAQLAADAVSLLPALPPDIGVVAGIARSGLMPATVIAAALHRPLLAFDQQTRLFYGVGAGVRMAGYVGDMGHVLIVDDTAAWGGAMKAALAAAKVRSPSSRITRAVIYCSPAAVGAVDLYAALYHAPHYLEWNWPNAGHGAACAYDFDGILCRNEDHREPLFLPRRTPIPLICSGRSESSRAYCLEWLAKWGVTCERLVLRPDDAPDDWETIAAMKADTYRGSSCVLFAESEPNQAERIAQRSGKPVLCPAAGRVFPPPPPPPPSDADVLLNERVRACPHREPCGCNLAKCAKFGRNVTYQQCWKCPELPE